MMRLTVIVSSNWAVISSSPCWPSFTAVLVFFLHCYFVAYCRVIHTVQLVCNKQHVCGEKSVLRASSLHDVSRVSSWDITKGMNAKMKGIWVWKQARLLWVSGKVSIDCCLRRHQRMWARTLASTAWTRLHGTPTSAFTKWDPTRWVYAHLTGQKTQPQVLTKYFC